VGSGRHGRFLTHAEYGEESDIGSSGRAGNPPVGRLMKRRDSCPEAIRQPAPERMIGVVTSGEDGL